jgi:hypothetical protein
MSAHVAETCAVAAQRASTRPAPRSKKRWRSCLWALPLIVAVAEATATITPFGFLPPPLQDLGNEPKDVVVADFNGDGKADLAIRNNFQASGEPCVLVRLGNGDGTFAPVDAGEQACGRLIVADFDNDGVPDLAGIGLDYVVVTSGNGDGTFQSLALYPEPVATLDIWDGAAADVNGDGWIDIVTSVTDAGFNGPESRIVLILLNNQDGTFSWLPSSYTAPAVLGDSGGPVRSGDFNGDGDVDLLVAFRGDLLLFLGNGDATFAAPVTIASPNTGGDVQVADLDGDGDLDVAAGMGTFPGTQSVHVLLGAGNGTFAAPVQYDGGGLFAIVIADYDGDGHADIAFNSSTYGSELGGAVGVLLGVGDGTFQSPPLVFPVITQPFVRYMATGDFNGDARPDLALVLEEGVVVDHAIMINVQSQFSGTVPTIAGAVMTASIVAGEGCEFSQAQVIPLGGHPDSPPTGSAPPGLAFPLGLLDFTVTGCTPGASLTVQVDYSFDLPFNVQYWKYGATSGNPAPHWYAIPHVQLGPRTLRFTIVDGGLGDDDLVANGTIVDAGGPASAPPQPVPVSGGAGLALLMMLLMAAGAFGTTWPRQPTARR